MKRIFSFLKVNRAETENKWWHRLAQVLIYGSSIIVFFIGLTIVISSYKEDQRRQVVLAPELIEIKPEQLDFMLRMDKIAGWESNFELPDGSYILNGKSVSKAEGIKYRFDLVIKKGKIQDGISVKNAFINTSLDIIVTLCWYIIWKFIIYKTLLYIVFGKRK